MGEPMLVERLSSAPLRVARAVNHRWMESIRVVPPAWDALTRELDIWSQRGQQARFWWRDDDASDCSAALQQLLQTRAAFGIPLAIAAVPAVATPQLAAALESADGISVLQHGWNHENHAATNRPKAELADGRAIRDVEIDLAKGRARSQELFGRLFLPILVPPFNFLAHSLTGVVAALGFSFVSVEGDFAGLPLLCRNVHVDLIDWHGAGTKDAAAVVRQALAALRLRRFGVLSSSSPIGIVTHHLRHDADAWKLADALLGRLVSHPAVAFPPMNEVFPSC